MSMEPSRVVTCGPGWSMEEAAAWSSDDRISFQTSLPSHSDSVQLQVVEYAAPAPAPATHDKDCSYPIQVFKEAEQAFHADYSLDSMEQKIHRFPPSLVDVLDRYKVPVTVAIGPYHHGSHSGVMEAERVKHMAANQCIKDSGRSLQEMYNEVSFVSQVARSRYYDVASLREDDFLPMMFFDACFLVQFMRSYDEDSGHMDDALLGYFYANFERIYTDIMMLENQIPWVVVKTILSFMLPEPSLWPLKKFIVAMRSCLKNQGDEKQIEKDDIIVDPGYEPPHLLGLVWFYIVGENKKGEMPIGDQPMSLSMSVAELLDVGITLVPKTETEAGLVDMGLERKHHFFGVLSVPPLCLTDANATWLVNMAAFELCRTSDFDEIDDGNSAVCSYLQLFVMLLDKKQHVHDLRERGVIQGGGLTSSETLLFFICIGKNMRVGRNYLKIMVKVEDFKQKMTCCVKLWLSIKKNRTRIVTVISAIGVVIGILSSLPALKPR
ncbi:hypothetical protein CFC21_009798 [Triticum aestivum]|uniref:Uncharacterized protein n=2 Tax=Triticum aestivum TaxID=4565 RepID=A0A9R1DJ89_WHEAT|nr:uncharacterized protein LOC123162397 [Triticum aestivum]KAF6992842.1 hypothetical protein CFC21_009798 [Triticum aestivum]